MLVILTFMPAYDIIMLIFLLFFNSNSTVGTGNFLITVDDSSIVEGTVYFDTSIEGDEKIAINFTQKIFKSLDDYSSQSESYIILFGQNKTYNLFKENKTYLETDIISDRLKQIVSRTFNLNEEEDSVFYTYEISPEKTAYYSIIYDELWKGSLIRIRDKSIGNLTTDISLKTENSSINVYFYPSEEDINQSVFEIPEDFTRSDY